MKICVVGSRSITSFDLAPYIPREAKLIITGGAKGIDALAEEYADKIGLSKLIIRPNYRRYGRAAPLLRNEEMIDMADMVLAVWDGKSKGCEYSIRYAENTGKKILVVRVG